MARYYQRRGLTSQAEQEPSLLARVATPVVSPPTIISRNANQSGWVYKLPLVRLRPPGRSSLGLAA